MPIVKTFKGKPVKRMSKTQEGSIKLIMVSAVPGHDGEQLTVSQSEWDLYGHERYHEAKPDVRRLAQ